MSEQQLYPLEPMNMVEAMEVARFGIFDPETILDGPRKSRWRHKMGRHLVLVVGQNTDSGGVLWASLSGREGGTIPRDIFLAEYEPIAEDDDLPADAVTVTDRGDGSVHVLSPFGSRTLMAGEVDAVRVYLEALALPVRPSRDALAKAIHAEFENDHDFDPEYDYWPDAYRLADALLAADFWQPAPEAHDHAGEPKVWCETHQHTHIASIPRFTYMCKSCGWGQWHKPDADAHEASCPGHETYEVEHVVRPVAPEADRDRVGVWFTASNGQSLYVKDLTDAGPRLVVDGQEISPLNVAAIREFSGLGSAPRMVSSVEELDALPVGSVIRMNEERGGGYVYEKFSTGWGRPFGGRMPVSSTILSGYSNERIATVLFVPSEGGGVVNDVKITAFEAGDMSVRTPTGFAYIDNAGVAALREHFAAEQPATPTGVELTCDVCANAYPTWFTDNDLWNLHGTERGGMECPSCFAAKYEAATGSTLVWRFAPQQPATPTPSTEQIGAALDEYRSRLEEEDPAIQRLNKTDPYVVASIFNQGYQAALVSPVPEQPTPLDPEPWMWNDRGIEHRLATIPETWHRPPNHNPYTFKPRPGFEQDRARYEQGGEPAPRATYADWFDDERKPE